MAEKVLGTVFSFRTEGLPAMQQAVQGFTSMSGALGGFVGKTMQLGASGAAIAGFGYAVMKPLQMLRESFFTVGAEFENIMIRFQDMSKRTGTSASTMFDFVSAAAYNIPYSFGEALEVTQQFEMMGVKLNKTYGSVKQLGEDIPVTYANAMSGLAAKSGASLTQIGHHIKSAIQAGRADYLEYWIGETESQMMKMSGVFIGTYQEQFDKVMKWLGTKYASSASKMSETLSATMVGFQDLRERIMAEVAGVTKPGERGAFWGLERTLAVTLRDLTKFFYTPVAGMTDALGYAEKMGKLLTEILLPAQMKLINETAKGEFVLAGPAAKAMELMKTFVRWLVSDDNRKAIVSIAKFISAIGMVAVAFGTWLMVMQVLLPLFTMFVSMAAPFAVGFGIIAAAALMAVNILRTNWRDGAVSFVGILDWLKGKLEWAANFFKVAFQIMWGAGVDGKRGAWVSKEAWDALGPKSQQRLIQFLRGWLWLKDNLTGALKYIKSHYKEWVDFLIAQFDKLKLKLDWIKKHPVLSLGIFMGALATKSIVGGIWGMLFGTSGKGGGGFGGGAIPVYVVNMAGGMGGGGDGGTTGIIPWIIHIFKTLSEWSLFGFGAGIGKIFSYFGMGALAKWFTGLGLLGDKIFAILVWGLKAAFLWVIPLIGALIVGYLVGMFVNWGLNKIPGYKSLTDKMTTGMADFLQPMGREGALAQQRANLAAIKEALDQKRISKDDAVRLTQEAERASILQGIRPGSQDHFEIHISEAKDAKTTATILTNMIQDRKRDGWLNNLAVGLSGTVPGMSGASIDTLLSTPGEEPVQ